MSEHQAIKEFFREELMLDLDEANVGPSDDLIQSGLLDSLSIMRLVHYLEEVYGLKVDGGDIVAENFGTLQAIGSFIESRRQHVAAQ